MADQRDQLKTTEAAALAGVSDRTIRSWIKDGHLPATRGEDGIRRVARAALLSYLAQRARAVAGPVAVSAPEAPPETASAGEPAPEAATDPPPVAEAAPDRPSDPEIARALTSALELVGRLTKENVDLSWRAGYWEAEARKYQERMLLLEAGPVAEAEPDAAPEAETGAASAPRWWEFWKRGN